METNIDIRTIIKKYSPNFGSSLPAFILNLVFTLLSKIIREEKLNQYLRRCNNKTGIDFIDEVFDLLNFTFNVSQKDRDKIPSQGPLLIVSNHPFGGIDGLMLIKLIYDVRSDVKIIVNNVLTEIPNLDEFFLPFNIFGGKFQKENVQRIFESIKKEEAVIIFPAGEVSRFSINGIRDGRWSKGILYFAAKYNTPILPVHIKGRNSLFFYFISLINKKISSLLLPSELLNKKNKNIEIKIGDIVPTPNLISTIKDSKLQLKLLKKHLYNVGNGKKEILNTEKSIIKPIDRKILKLQLKEAPLLGITNDGKKIFILTYNGFPEVIREVARLREITFRGVGEGTGNRLDMDLYDKLYRHIVLWDEENLEVVGAYRIGVCEELLLKHGTEGLYTSTLFNFSDNFKKKLPFALELGRSFVQRKYWNSYSLDYLWQGIGAFLYNHPETKYLFGGVSLSGSYNTEAKELLVFFYTKWFKGPFDMVTAKNHYSINPNKLESLEATFPGVDYKSELKILKQSLKMFGFSIPTLFKQYSELCSDNGCSFLDFGIDYDFNSCIDGFIFIEVDKIKPHKRERYIRKTDFLKVG